MAVDSMTIGKAELCAGAFPFNSLKACYRIGAEAFELIRTFGTDAWQATLEQYLERREGAPLARIAPL